MKQSEADAIRAMAVRIRERGRSPGYGDYHVGYETACEGVADDIDEFMATVEIEEKT